MEQNKLPIGFIGYGNMAHAIASALNESGYSNIVVNDINPTQTERANVFAEIISDKQTLLNRSEFVFLSVKPQMAQEAVTGLNFAGKVLISIMAGTSIPKLKELTGAEAVVRVMPNLNATVRLSYNAYVCDGLTDRQKSDVDGILSKFGLAAETTEDMLNAITGIAGSGPAYVFRFFRGLLAEAQNHDFSPTEAIEMCGMMIAGSVGNLLHSVYADKPDSFKEALEKLDAVTNAVCSKGGTTIEGINYLDEHQFSDIVSEAAARAIRRAKELSK